MKKVRKVFVILFVLCNMLLQLFPVMEIQAANEIFEIDSEQDLLDLVAMSQNYDFSGKTINLNTDIQITGSYSGSDSLSFNKNNDIPFRGTFNGNGHTITNLNHESTLNYETCTGLFGYTDGAYIHDFSIKDSYIGADSLGGAVIGRALNTLIENVSVSNTTISVKCADNVITLITDGGLVGGGIVGVLDSSVMYNCEVSGVEVVNNATEAVAAISGKGLYLGALVGDAHNSTIEYSRAINNTRVRNKYDVAVGAVGGNTLYVGGIVGELRAGSNVIDCYSTADLYFYCATYVSVGGGNSGHIGGIAGAAYGTNDTVVRSHFAGTATSTQYNAVLVIPIVQSDVNIFGLIDKNDGEYVEHSYYMSSTANAKGTLGDGNTTDNSGPLVDATYANRDFFEENGYDIVGNISRKTAYSADHINKWVMYHDDVTGKTYPIHGESFMAAFDYPNAASVTILANSANSLSETTNIANKFAMQIVEPNSANLQTIVVTPNSGYRLYGWYKSVADSTYVGGHEYYEAIFAQGNVVSQYTGYAFSPVEDKDLYVARMQAGVTFHDYQGNVIDRSGANDSETNDNYYFYKEQLPTFEPGNKPVDTNEKFIGWTTVEGTHVSITSNELEGYKANGQFYEAGDEVTTTLQLYPVYASLISNIHLIYEGNELDAVNDVTLREGYGRAFASIDENNVATISITKEYSDPTHYRFLGWYEDGHRISREESFVLEDTDLTQEHTYTARFEYLVDYYVKDQYTNSGSYSYKNGALYQSVWHTYGEELQQISAPNFISSTFDSWVLDGYQGTQSAVGYIVTKADDKAYSKVNSNTVSESSYTISITTDFPNSATIDKSKSSARITLTVQENPNYHLQFWTRDDWGAFSRVDHTIGKDNPYVHNYGTGYSYQFRARMLADATFHQYDGSSTNVLRGYQENVLQDGNGVREYHYLMDDKLIDNSAITSLGGEVNISASPSALDRSGYYFVGWIDKDSLSEEEIAYVFDIDEYTSSSLEKAKPYVLNTDDLVEKAMPNIYAIYVPYSILTTTNIKEVGVRAPQNLPSDPTYVGLDDTQESSTLSFMIPDGSEYVIGNSGETYRLTKFTVRINGGEEERIESPYTYTVKVGNQYVFMAYYEPLVVNFHINAIDTITFIRNNGQSINHTNETMPEPQFDIASTIAADTGYIYLFVGYTEEESPTIYHRLDSATEIDRLMLVKGGTIVTHSMDLYPVYAPISISIQSNIDGQLSASGYNPSVIRYMANYGNDEVELVATSVQGYTFKGWYSQYTNDTNPGTLLSTNSNVVLDKESAFEGAIYTAVYEPTITVNFHGTDEMRSVIYSTSFPIGSRSFVTESTQFENGEGELITIEGSPIDGEAFERILVQLSSSQNFVEWVYQDGEGNIHRWNEFSTNAITTNMDLYPSVVEMSAYEVPTDLEGTRIFEEATDILNLSLERNIAGSETTYTCKANFKDEYYRIQGDVAGNNRNQLVPTIGIHLVEGIYVNEKIENVLANSSVALYTQSEGDLIEEKIVDAEGNAIFPLFGTINVTTHATGIEDDFLYTVVRNDDASALETVRFSLRDGETKQIYVPYGQYTIKQDNEYSWRYSDQQEVSGLVVSNLRNANAEFHNEKANLKWFDHSERRINKYEN